jgi:hypothetical protein
VGRRFLLAVLVATVFAADAGGVYSLGFWALVGAVPVAAACGLVSFAAFLDARDDAVASLQALLWAPTLVLLLAAAAARGPAVSAGDVPRLGTSALVGCVAMLVLKLAVHAAGRLQVWLARRAPAAVAARS